MEDQDILRILEVKSQAMAALRKIVGEEYISVMISDMGSHYGMWVTWNKPNGDPVTRQFWWGKEEPSHDSVRLQWIYDAFYKYGNLQKMIECTTWKDEDPEHEYNIY